MQYVQVYLDAAYDLLATSARDAAKPLEVREDPHTGEVSAVGARTVEVTSLASAMRTLRDGERCVYFIIIFAPGVGDENDVFVFFFTGTERWRTTYSTRRRRGRTRCCPWWSGGKWVR